jgi:hypothetical protein
MTHFKIWQVMIPLTTDNQTSLMKFNPSNETNRLFSIRLNSDFIHIKIISIPKSEEDFIEETM